MRTTVNNLDPDFCEKQEVDMRQFQTAIGYLSTWAQGTYPFVSIFDDGGADFVAIYKKDPDGNTDYAIGAVYHHDEKRYSFHS